MAKYIKSIEIRDFWGKYNITWDITPSVNILSGGNGSGKSTVLRSIAEMFRDGTISTKRRSLMHKIVVTFEDGTKIDSDTRFDPSQYKIQMISTFDMSMKKGDSFPKLHNGDIVTELDWELYLLHAGYLDYQLDIGKEVIKAMSTGQSTDEIIAHKVLFYDIIDSLFAATKKTIDRDNNALMFTSGTRKISPYELSSGEKQILIILTSTLIRNRKPAIMIMDEPEISLHFDWQRRLIEDILRLNPSMQLIIATHSPAVIMNGWIDCVSEVSELMKGHDHGIVIT